MHDFDACIYVAVMDALHRAYIISLRTLFKFAFHWCIQTHLPIFVIQYRRNSRRLYPSTLHFNTFFTLHLGAHSEWCMNVQLVGLQLLASFPILSIASAINHNSIESQDRKVFCCAVRKSKARAECCLDCLYGWKRFYSAFEWESGGNRKRKIKRKRKRNVIRTGEKNWYSTYGIRVHRTITHPIHSNFTQIWWSIKNKYMFARRSYNSERCRI